LSWHHRPRQHESLFEIAMQRTFTLWLAFVSEVFAFVNLRTLFFVRR